MKRGKKKVALILLLIMILNITPMNVSADHRNKFEISFINVTDDRNKQGDATLISCKGKYVLIDGGMSGAYTDKLKKYLTQYCNKQKGKIVLEAVIASHNHSDHVGGLTKLLNDTETFTVKKVIKSKYDPATSFNNACNKAQSVITLNEKSATQSFTINGTNITVYPPINDAKEENNRCMLVTVKGALTCLLAGDLYFSGIKSVQKKYPQAFNIKGGYDICKFGHHGHRGGGNGGVLPAVVDEVTWYKKNVGASDNVLTTSKKFVNLHVDVKKLNKAELSIRKNFEYIKKNLPNSVASYQGTLLMTCNGGNLMGYNIG